MSWWSKKQLVCSGSVLYRGGIVPRADNYAYLADLGVDLGGAEPAPGAHWRLSARHSEWGAAEIVCLRDAPLPPAIVIDHDPRLCPAERDLVKSAGSSVQVTMQAVDGNVLRGRKQLLRYLRAVMADDGVAAVDHTAQAFWSRANLDDELSHDAELDILSLFTVHALEGNDGACFWMHTHGLTEIGHYDFDVLAPSADFARGPSAWDVIRALAFAVVEGAAEWDGKPFAVAGGLDEVRFVPARRFLSEQRAAFSEWAAAVDEAHLDHHAVCCEPGAKRFGLFSKKARPLAWLSGPLGDDVPIHFSDAASELMARRATATWSLFGAAVAEFAALGLTSLVKLRYESTYGSAEHLWFSVDGWKPDGVDATLLNEPFGEIGFSAGDRRTHELARLSDWMLITPFGSASPRSTHVVRRVRERRAELETLLRERSAGAEE